jgi:hypothetical protein
MSIYQSFKRLQTGPFMIGIAVFGVLTFTITYAFNMTFSRNPKKEALFTVTLPSGKSASFNELDREHAATTYSLFFDSSASNRNGLMVLAGQLRSIDLLRHMLRILSWNGMHENAAAEQQKKDKKNDEVMQLMLVNAIARDRGIDVATSEVAEWLQGAFQSTDQYKSIIAYYNITYPQFESLLREALLYRRAIDLMLAQTPLPSGDDLVKEWCERNERFTFELVDFKAEDRKKAIDQASITNDELKKWFDEKKEVEKQKYKEQERLQLEVVAVTNEMLAPDAKPNDAFDALVKSIVLQDTDAQTYHSMAQSERFRKSPATDSAPDSQPVIEVIPFDEKDAKEKATREVRIARALEKVKSEAMDAMTKPGFDLKAIAEKYGLKYETFGEPKTLDELRKDKVYGCFGWISGIPDAKEGDFLSSYQPAPGAIEITRVTKKTAARIPEIADMREKLLSEYLDHKSMDRARDDAIAFRDAVLDAKVAEGENRFAAVAKEKGLEVKALAPISKGAQANGDYNAADIGKDDSQFLISLYQGGLRTPDPFALKKDGLSTPLANSEGKLVIVAHLLDRQLPTIADMSVADYPKLRDQGLTYFRQKKCLEMTTSEALSKALQLKRRGDTGFAQ